MLWSRLRSKITQPLPGLIVMTEYITPTEELNLILCLRAQKWNKKLPRYTQQYGYEYDLNTKTVIEGASSIPSWIDRYARQLVSDSYFTHKPDQVVVNRYRQNEGLNAHVDNTKCFGDTIASLSLNASCKMIFSRVNNIINNHLPESVELSLQPRTLVIMKDEARYKYRHGIHQLLPGSRIRYSITFRNVLKSKKK